MASSSAYFIHCINITQYLKTPFPLWSVLDILCKFVKESWVRSLTLSNSWPKIQIFISYPVCHKLITLGTIPEIKPLHGSERCCAVARLLVSSWQPYESNIKIWVQSSQYNFRNKNIQSVVNLSWIQWFAGRNEWSMSVQRTAITMINLSISPWKLSGKAQLAGCFLWVRSNLYLLRNISEEQNPVVWVPSLFHSVHSNAWKSGATDPLSQVQ